MTGMDLLNESVSKAMRQGDWGARHAHQFMHALGPESPAAALVFMLRGWIMYADAHREKFESSIGDDRVLGREWARIGSAFRGLLNGDLGQMDGGTLDGLICDVLTLNGFDPDTL